MLMCTGIAQAVESAQTADVAIVCVGDSAEAVGYDGSVGVILPAQFDCG